MDNELTCNGLAAISFLNSALPSGPWVLTAIDSNMAILTTTFYPDEAESCRAWIERHNDAGWNIYFMPNTPLVNRVAKKTSKDEMGAVAYFYVDLDPKAGEPLDSERDMIQRQLTTAPPPNTPKPTFVIDSGGGFWAFWKLANPISLDVPDRDRVLSDIESRGTALEKNFMRADGCRNIDRIARLVGTINWPSEKKLKNGRQPTLATLVISNVDAAYPLDAFPAPVDRHIQTVHAQRGQPIANIDALDQWLVSQRVKDIVLYGRAPGEVKDNDDSGSAWLFDGLCNMLRSNVPDDVALSVICDERFGISANVRKNGTRMEKYALRQVQQAHKAIAGAAPEDWHPRPQDGHPPSANYHNARAAVLRLGIVCEHDRYKNRMKVGGHQLNEFQGEVTDNACAMLRQLILETFRFDPKKENLRDAVDQLCLENTTDAICDYLDGLVWDGKPRLNALLSSYFGATDNELNTAIGRIMMIAAVRRAREPGCKFDQIVVLEGQQGTGKSSALAILAGSDNFSDQDILTLDAKAQVEALEGVWLFELSELSGLNRSDMNKMKAFASRQVDRARAAYARKREDRPRRCIFIGTTNDQKYLRDKTGNRRFWPVETTQIDLEALKRDRDMLWAEAAQAEAAGETITLPKRLWLQAEQLQMSRVEEDPWVADLAEVSGAVSGQFERITTAEIYKMLDIPKKDRNAGTAKRIGDTMRSLGWEGPTQWSDGKSKPRGYVRPASIRDDEPTMNSPTQEPVF